MNKNDLVEDKVIQRISQPETPVSEEKVMMISGISVCVDEKCRFTVPKQIRDAYTFLTGAQLDKQMLMFAYDLEKPDEIKIKIVKKEKR